MPPDDPRRVLLERLRENWSLPCSPLGPNGEGGVPAILRLQVAAFSAGLPASFPYLAQGRDEVTWFTVAPSPDALRSAIQDLRAWLVPNHAAELRVESGVDGATGGLRPLISAVSPGGYFVWKTRLDGSRAAAARLQEMYELSARRPSRTGDLVPTVYELRQRFRAALVVGDRDAAQAAVDVIAREALDSATNVAFMRVKLADHFGEHALLANWSAVRDLVQLRLPASVRTSLVRAFHSHYLADAELDGDVESAARTYAEKVESVLGPLFDVCRADEGPAIARCLAYRSRIGRVPPARLAELRELNDGIVAAALRTPHAGQVAAPAAQPDPEFTVLGGFEVATRRGDQRSVQELGEFLLSARWDELSDSDRARVVAAVTESLVERANPRLSGVLGSRTAAKRNVPAPPPQDWRSFFDACANRDWQGAASFLERGDRPTATAEGPATLRDIIGQIQALPSETGPGFALAQTVVAGAITAAIDDCRKDIGFPRTQLADAYLALLECLSLCRGGSSQHEDASLFLLLADAVLQVDAGHGKDVVSLVDSWWSVRPSEALLPFLLDALSLFSFHGSGRDEALALWVRGADWIRTEAIALGPGEHRAWNSIGLRLGVDTGTVQLYLGALDSGERADPLADAGLGKIAIVSLRGRQAQEAARIIGARSKAEVVVVSETDVGSQVRSARNADVILVVWSAITHAVFRGFDAVRERVAYVQGTGAESIVLTLERAVLHGMR